MICLCNRSEYCNKLHLIGSLINCVCRSALNFLFVSETLSSLSSFDSWVHILQHWFLFPKKILSSQCPPWNFFFFNRLRWQNVNASCSVQTICLLTIVSPSFKEASTDWICKILFLGYCILSYDEIPNYFTFPDFLLKFQSSLSWILLILLIIVSVNSCIISFISLNLEYSSESFLTEK